MSDPNPGLLVLSFAGQDGSGPIRNPGPGRRPQMGRDGTGQGLGPVKTASKASQPQARSTGCRIPVYGPVAHPSIQYPDPRTHTRFTHPPSLTRDGGDDDDDDDNDDDDDDGDRRPGWPSQIPT